MKSEKFQNYKQWFDETDDLDALNDAYENHLFDLKNVLCNSISLEKLFLVKIKHFLKIEAAYRHICGEEYKEINLLRVGDEPVVDFSLRILDAFDSYYTLRNALLLKIKLTDAVKTIACLAYQLCSVEEQFSERWRVQLPEKKDIIMSRSPDVIALRGAILEFDSIGDGTFCELIANLSGANVLLINELYRRNMILSYGN